MLRKLPSSQELDFDFISLRREFDEAVKSNHKERIDDVTNRSFSAVTFHKNSNLFSKIFNFIPKETVSTLFEIFQHEFDTNKKSTMKEVYSLRNEINFEYKKKLLEVLLFLLFSIKHLNVNSGNSGNIGNIGNIGNNQTKRKATIKKANSLISISQAHSFTLRGDQKILFQVNKPKFVNLSKEKEIEIESIIEEEPKHVKLIHNYTQLKNKEVEGINANKARIEIASSRENKFKAEPKEKALSQASNKLNLEEKTLSTKKKQIGKSNSLSNSDKVTFVTGNSSGAAYPSKNEVSKHPKENTSTNSPDINKNKNFSADISLSYNGANNIQPNNNVSQMFSDNYAKSTQNKANLLIENSVSPFIDTKYYYPHNMRIPQSHAHAHSYLANYNNSELMKINNTTDAYNYNNYLRMSYNQYIGNPSIPLMRQQFNLNMHPINHYSQGPYIHPEIVRNNTDAFKAAQYPINLSTQSATNCNKINNTPVNNSPDIKSSITNSNPYYTNNEGSKKRENETVSIMTSNTYEEKPNNNSNDFLKKKKKRDDSNKKAFTQSSYNKGDNFGEQPSNIDMINISHHDDVQVKMFTEEIVNDCTLDCSTTENDKSVTLSSPNILPDCSTLNDPSESFLSITGVNTSHANTKDDETVKKLVTIFNQKQFNTSSLEMLKQTLKLSDEKSNLIKEYLINKKYPKNQKEYIFLFKKEHEDKGLYLKVDAIKKMYSLIRHRIIKDSAHK